MNNIKLTKRYLPLKFLKSKKVHLTVSCFLIIIMCVLLKSPSTSQLIAIDDPASLYEGENLTVYFGRDSCFSCSETTKYLLSILPELSSNIYYFDTDAFRHSPEFQRILSDFQIVKISNGSYSDGLLLVSKMGH